MFEKVIAIIIIILMLCTCALEEPPVPEAFPENSLQQEEPEAPELTDLDYQKLRNLLEYPEKLNSTPCGYEGGNPYKAAGIEVPKEIEEILFRIRKTGEFSGVRHIENEKIIYAALMSLPMVSRYDLEPELAKQLEPLFDAAGDECIYPAEWVRKAAGEIFGYDARITHETLDEMGFVYHEKAMVYTPPHRGMESVFPYIVAVEKMEVKGTDWTAYEVEFVYLSANNLYGCEIGDHGDFIECDIENGESLFDKPEFKEFIESGKDRYTARFVDENGEFKIVNLVKNITIPKAVEEHIYIINEIINYESFGMEVDWDNYFFRLYLEKPYGEGFDSATPPDALVPASTFYEVPMEYNGYYVDTACDVYKTELFSSKAEVFEYLCQWVTPEIIEKSSFEHHVMDFDKSVYLLRHSRGYGVSYYGDTVITEQTETEMTAEAIIYYVMKEERGTAEIKFEKIDGNWIIVSVTDNYY